MENFTNTILTPENIPDIDSKEFNNLEKKYRTILFIRIVIFVLIAVAAYFTVLFFSVKELPETVQWGVPAVVLLITVYSVLITIFGFPRKGYLVRENDISYQTGLIIFKSTSVPFNRIQHVEVSQGILGKMYKIATVKIYTAGGSASDLSVPGLPVDVAAKLKDFLSEKISSHE